MMLLPNTRLNAAIQHLINQELKTTHTLSDEYLSALASGQITYGHDNSDLALINAIARVRGLQLLSNRLGLTGNTTSVKPRTVKRQLKRLAREIAYWTADAKDVADTTDSIEWQKTYGDLEEARKLIFSMLNQSFKPLLGTLSFFENEETAQTELVAEGAQSGGNGATM